MTSHYRHRQTKSGVNQTRHWNFDLFNFPTHTSHENFLCSSQFICWLVNLPIVFILVMNMVVVKKASVCIWEVSTDCAFQDMDLFYLSLTHGTCPGCLSIVIGGIQEIPEYSFLRRSLNPWGLQKQSFQFLISYLCAWSHTYQ